jgi:hypothetical protein
MNGYHDATSAPRTQSRDTSPWAERILLDHWKRMPPWEKADLVRDLSASLVRLCVAGLAARFPEVDSEELERRSVELRLGPELYRRIRGTGNE